MDIRTTLAGGLATMVTTLAVAGQSVTFTVIGPGTAVDVSPDGTYVTGTNGADSFIWTAEGGQVMVPAGGFAVAISNDGMTLAGSQVEYEDGDGDFVDSAGNWTMADGWLPFGGFGMTGCPSVSTAYGMDGSGEVVVGLGWDGCAAGAFRWTAEDGMFMLPAPNTARANGISNDGMYVGGWIQADNGQRRAAVWDPKFGFTLPLEGTEGNDAGGGEVYGFNTDGSAFVGENFSSTEGVNGQFVFSNDEGLTALGKLPCNDLFGASIALCVSDNGNVVGGQDICGFGPFAINTATIWFREADEDLINFQDYLVDLGAEIPENLVLGGIRAMTPDGKTFVGFGREGFALTAWIVTIEDGGGCPTCPDFNLDGEVGGADLGILLAAWGTDEPCIDINGDGTVDGADLGALLAAWGPCPK